KRSALRTTSSVTGSIAPRPRTCCIICPPPLPLRACCPCIGAHHPHQERPIVADVADQPLSRPSGTSGQTLRGRPLLVQHWCSVRSGADHGRDGSSAAPVAPAPSSPADDGAGAPGGQGLSRRWMEEPHAVAR